MNSSSPRQNDEKQSLDQAILTHIERHRVSTFEVISKLDSLHDQLPAQRRQRLRQLVQEKQLQAGSLHHGLRGWWRPAQDDQRPLSESSKLQSMALLRFCWLTDRRRHLLTPSEMQTSFPQLYRPGMKRGYYVELAEKEQGHHGRLGLAIVDAGNRGRWDRVLVRLKELRREHSLRAGFREFVRAGRFELTLITVLPQKAKRLQLACQKLPDEDTKMRLRVLAMPELLPLIAGNKPGPPMKSPRRRRKPNKASG